MCCEVAGRYRGQTGKSDGSASEESAPSCRNHVTTVGWLGISCYQAYQVVLRRDVTCAFQSKTPAKVFLFIMVDHFPILLGSRPSMPKSSRVGSAYIPEYDILEVIHYIRGVFTSAL